MSYHMDFKNSKFEIWRSLTAIKITLKNFLSNQYHCLTPGLYQHNKAQNLPSLTGQLSSLKQNTKAWRSSDTCDLKLSWLTW